MYDCVMPTIVTKNEKIAENTFNYLKDHIRSSDLVLDIGTGNGLVAGIIKNKIGAYVSGLDVIDLNLAPNTTKIFDGKKIPYCDNTFDVSVCSFILHHSRNLEDLFSEIVRVTKREILILEDIPETFFDRVLERFHRALSTFRYFSSYVLLRKDSQWKALFKKNDLVLKKAADIPRSRDIYYPVHRRFYVLQKKPLQKNL